MARASRGPRPGGRTFLAFAGLLLGGFLAAAGAGSGNGLVLILGLSVAVSALIYRVYTGTQGKLTGLVEGSGHVITASPPPATSARGRCELHLVVQAPRLAATAVRHRDALVPVAKWPTPGTTLPILVHPKDPRQIRIRWEEVPSHAEAAETAAAAMAAPPAAMVWEQGDALAARTATGTLAPEEPALVADAVPEQRAAPEPVSAPPAEPADAGWEPWLAVYGSPIRDVGVTLVVADLARSLTFYRDTLGFFEIDGGSGAALLLVGNGRLLLREHPGVRARPPRLVHMTLDVVDVQAAYDALREKGVDFVDEPRPVVRGESLELWAASFHDPDGHGVALTCWRSREETAHSE